MKRYNVRQSSRRISDAGVGLSAPRWAGIPALSVDHFLKEGSGHRPSTSVRAVYDRSAIHLLFTVDDRFVRCTRTGRQSDVWNDSCVEWFVRPKSEKGYFNFEVNAGGALYASYVEDPQRQPDGSLKRFTLLPAALLERIAISHSLPRVVEPEIRRQTAWSIGLSVPLRTFEPFVGPIGVLRGGQWRANFYKCGDQTSHPHWASWNPVSKKNFHCPDEFGLMVFS